MTLRNLLAKAAKAVDSLLVGGTPEQLVERAAGHAAKHDAGAAAFEQFAAARAAIPAPKQRPELEPWGSGGKTTLQYLQDNKVLCEEIAEREGITPEALLSARASYLRAVTGMVQTVMHRMEYDDHYNSLSPEQRRQYDAEYARGRHASSAASSSRDDYVGWGTMAAGVAVASIVSNSLDCG